MRSVCPTAAQACSSGIVVGRFAYPSRTRPTPTAPDETNTGRTPARWSATRSRRWRATTGRSRSPRASRRLDVPIFTTTRRVPWIALRMAEAFRLLAERAGEAARRDDARVSIPGGAAAGGRSGEDKEHHPPRPEITHACILAQIQRLRDYVGLEFSDDSIECFGQTADLEPAKRGKKAGARARPRDDNA